MGSGSTSQGRSDEIETEAAAAAARARLRQLELRRMRRGCSFCVVLCHLPPFWRSVCVPACLLGILKHKATHKKRPNQIHLTPPNSPGERLGRGFRYHLIRVAYIFRGF